MKEMTEMTDNKARYFEIFTYSLHKVREDDIFKKLL